MKTLVLLLLFQCYAICFGSISVRDELSRIIKIENSDGSGIEYHYDTNGNQTNRVLYPAPELTLTVDPPQGGTATGGGKAPRDTVLQLSALPAEGFLFVAWLRPDGSVFSTSPTVSHMLNGQGSLIAKFALAVGPLISEQPQGGQFISGTTVTLSVSATGKEPLSYTWTHNGHSIAGAFSSSYSLQNASFLDAGTYAVEVTDSGGTTKSREALVTIPIHSYAEWQSRFFTPEQLAANDPAAIGPEGRSSASDMTNLMKFALGVTADGVEAMLHPMRVTGSQQVMLEFPHLIGGGAVTYTPQVSSDLKIWDSTGSHFESVSPALPATDGITETLRYRIRPDSSFAGSPKLFFRLSVQQTLPDLVFRDDFDGGALDLAKWTQQDGYTTFQSGYVTINSPTTWTAPVDTKGKYTVSGRMIVVEWRMQRLHGFDAYLRLHDESDSLNTFYAFESSWPPNAPHGLIFSRDGAFGKSDIFNGKPTSEWRVYRLTIDDRQVRVERGIDFEHMDEKLEDTLATSIIGKKFYLVIGGAGPDQGRPSTCNMDFVSVKSAP